MENFAITKEMYLELKNKIEFLELIMPKSFSLTDIAKDLNISRQTLTHYVKANFEPEVEFYKKNNRIHIDVSILYPIRRHYAQ
jgi:predicted DNA-binding protein YlxM (UPF0122 family)